MFKYFIIFYLLVFSDSLIAKSHKNTKHMRHGHTTAYSMCSRSLIVEKTIPAQIVHSTQTIIVAIETLSENKCKILGKSKAEQYTKAGWKCVGYKDEELFSCESQKSKTYAIYKGVRLDHLTFTNLQNHRMLLAYINSNSNELCHEDKVELTSAGVKDATCHMRRANSL